MDDFVRNIAIESWTLYTVGMLLIACRIISRRIKLGGLHNLQVEDWLMVVASVFFTGFAAAVNEVAKNGSNYMDPEVAAALTPEEAATAVYGSKMTLVMEMCTVTTVWLVKACLLLLYYRLTKEAYFKQMLAVKAIAVFCIIGYVLIITLCLAYWCRPIEEYWRVPVAQSECATYYNHMKFTTSFNVSSDLMLLLIPLPIILRTTLPPKRKLVLCLVLGLGVFNIIAAVLNRYYNFSNPNDLGYVYWYVGEVAISIFVGNIPLCWPLVRRVFRADTWSDSEQPGVQAPPLPRKPPRAKPRLYSSLWLTTWGQTAWDKMDDVEAVHTKRTEDTDMGDDSGIPSHGSEIELTPTWHRRANLTAVDSATISSGQVDEDARTQEESRIKEADRGVVIVKTIQIMRE